LSNMTRYICFKNRLLFVSVQFDSSIQISHLLIQWTNCAPKTIFLSDLKKTYLDVCDIWQVMEMMISLGYILSHSKYRDMPNVCIVLGKWVCQTFIYGCIVTKYGYNSLKYIISKGGLYYFIFNIRLLVKFWMWCKI
jgi:hypothetical protein